MDAAEFLGWDLSDSEQGPIQQRCGHADGSWGFIK